ncbi:hypothetical protein EZS27_003958 [termite gut metagenome]|uniref:Uncharacterized protein n=1 Tax=termite gut metagenome TaxID=433724 RepID=A0A5J4SQV5_9ZZZZ
MAKEKNSLVGKFREEGNLVFYMLMRQVVCIDCRHFYNPKTKPLVLNKVQQPDFCNMFIW